MLVQDVFEIADIAAVYSALCCVVARVEHKVCEVLVNLKQIKCRTDNTDM